LFTALDLLDEALGVDLVEIGRRPRALDLQVELVLRRGRPPLGGARQQQRDGRKGEEDGEERKRGSLCHDWGLPWV
jgi:hypothetical protein